MNSDPSPLDRLFRLEREVEELRAFHDSGYRQLDPNDSQSSRPVWPADELLLTRLLRRSPLALSAYQEPAELTYSEQKGLRLTAGKSASIFQFCELTGGDAVVWVPENHPDWVEHCEPFLQMFVTCPNSDSDQPLVLQALPLFKPIVRSKEWTLFRQGQMVPQTRAFPEQAEQANLLHRLESLERMVVQQQSKQVVEGSELRMQVRILQDQLARLLRLMETTHE